MNLDEKTLPPGWAVALVEDLFACLEDGRTLHQGWSPQCENEPSPTDGCWGVLRTTAIQAGAFLPEYNKLLPHHLSPRPLLEVSAGDILITCAGPRARCGVACLVKHTRKRLMISGKMYRFRVPKPLVDPHYVEAYLQTAVAQADINVMKTGGSDSGLNLTHDRFRRLQVPVAPRPEQGRIVAEVEEHFTRLDAAVTALKRVQTNLKRYRTAVLKAACDGRLVPTEAELARREERSYETSEQLLARILQERRAKWEADQLAKMLAAGKPPKDDSWKQKYKEPDPPDTSNLAPLPEGWTWASVGQVSWSVKDGPHYSPVYAEHGIPFITGGQVRPSGIDFASAKRISPELHAELSKRCKPEPGDMLYTKGGTTGIARVNSYDIEFGVWVHVAVLKLVNSIEPFYLQHVLNSPLCYGQSQRFTHGVGNQDLGLTRMVRIAFALPPLGEQRRIVDEVDRRISGLDAVQLDVGVQCARADRLRQSILKRAFEGKLVPQDPNDEPASVLLERIRTERAAQAKTKLKSRGAKRAIAAGREI